MFPPNSLLLVLLVSISFPAIVASPLSTVAISRSSNATVVCALVHSTEGYDLSCTTVLPERQLRTYKSGSIASSAIAGGDGFLCFLSLSANLSSMVWWGMYQESSYYGSSKDYKRVYRGPPLADLSSGDSRVCAIVGDGDLRRPICWRWKQLVFPDGLSLADIAVGGEFVCGLLRVSLEIRCFGNDTSVVGHEPPGSYFTIAAGTRHACAVSKEGRLVCWGAGDPGVEGATPSEIISLALGENKTCTLDSNGSVACWGKYSRLPYSLASTEFMAIQAKGSAICGILRVNYSLACWGNEILYHNPFIYDRVLPGTCVPSSSCSCGPLEGSGTLCSDGNVVCHLCESKKVTISPSASPPPPPAPASRRAPPPPSPNKASTPQWSRKTTYIMIGSVGSAIGLVALLLFFFFCFGQCNGRVHDADKMHSATRGALPPGVPSALARMRGEESSQSTSEWRFSSLIGRGHSIIIEEFPLSVLLAATDNFAESHKIGSGSFGSVYRATLGDGRVVAIKRAEASVSSSNTAAATTVAACENKRPDKERAFLAELALLSRVNHKNLVRLLGYCKQGAERVLVYEFMANGTLHDHLHRLSSPTLASWGARLRVALDAARGLEYLHVYAVPPIIHRDIKSSNILLDDTWTAQVSDFGLSLMTPVDGAENEPDCSDPVRAAGTVGYMDPEYYRLQRLTAKSDVYSFGVVLLELLTGCKVINRYEDSGTPKNVVEFAVPHIAADDIHKVLDPKLPLPTPSEIEAVTYVGYLAIDCVIPEGKERPTMTEVVNGLERAVVACVQ
ncbi:serine/threonine-protein kinase-like protein CCR4 [Canna indica]|uniref:Serine/threonine-protein kinase-like protein CCR4 n=1 Tax=Canna indica TaxID=4628 RepID=A0AAQ3Q9X6_9LILI|nr:serine/threonine-protein kinase-like protein CCR4 [Canna indica]